MSAATQKTQAGANGARPRVLVKEKIGDPGVALLREHFDVDVLAGWSAEELDARIGEYEGILIRSATKLDSGLLGKAQRLRAVGRAGVEKEYVDVEAATRRGIVVMNTPGGSNVTTAEQGVAMLMALARSIP